MRTLAARLARRRARTASATIATGTKSANGSQDSLRKPCGYTVISKSGREQERRAAGLRVLHRSFKAVPKTQAHQHFGLAIVSCERGDVSPLPSGVMIYDDCEQRVEPLPLPKVPRVEVIDELNDAVVNGKPPLHSGEWAMATMEVCLAILRSSPKQREVQV